MTADLIAFISARLDEDEQTARACTSAPWEIEIPPMVHVSVQARRDNKWKWGSLGYVATAERDEDRAHIARHDPARVLRETAALREVVDDLQQAEYTLSTTAPNTPPHDLMTGAVNYLRRTVQHLAAIWADHDDYKPEWRP